MGKPEKKIFLESEREILKKLEVISSKIESLKKDETILLKELRIIRATLCKDNPLPISIPTKEGNLKILFPDEIMRFEADKEYTICYLVTGNRLMLSKKISIVEYGLYGHNFFRTHKSHLVNIRQVSDYNYGKSIIIMRDGSRVQLSRRRKIDFLKRLSDLYPVFFS